MPGAELVFVEGSKEKTGMLPGKSKLLNVLEF
jgi:hypothetical protein